MDIPLIVKGTLCLISVYSWYKLQASLRTLPATETTKGFRNRWPHLMPTVIYIFNYIFFIKSLSFQSSKGVLFLLVEIFKKDEAWRKLCQPLLIKINKFNVVGNENENVGSPLTVLLGHCVIWENIAVRQIYQKYWFYKRKMNFVLYVWRFFFFWVITRKKKVGSVQSFVVN